MGAPILIQKEAGCLGGIAIGTYFTRLLSRTNLLNLIRIRSIFAKSYVFYMFPNSFEFVRMRSHKFVRSSYFVKYVQIGFELPLLCHPREHFEKRTAFKKK